MLKQLASSRRIVWIILIALPLVAWFIVLSVGQATITITVKPEAHEQSFSFSADDLDGEIISTPVTIETTFKDFQTVTSTPALASGTIRLVNTSSRSQPLVATTRLLSDGGILFRTTETVVVPAQSERTVAVAADQPGAAGNIPPDHFTIVALSTSAQAQIYGISDVGMTGGLVYDTVLTEADLTEAKLQADDALRQQAAEQLTTLQRSDRGLIASDLILLQDTTYQFSAEAGETIEQLGVTSTTQAITISFAPTKLNDLLETLSNDTVDSSSLQAQLQYTSQDNLVITGTVTMNQVVDQTTFNKIDFTNKTPEQLRITLKQLPNVERVATTLTPQWRTTTPLLPSHITIITKPSD